MNLYMEKGKKQNNPKIIIMTEQKYIVYGIINNNILEFHAKYIYNIVFVKGA